MFRLDTAEEEDSVFGKDFFALLGCCFGVFVVGTDSSLLISAGIGTESEFLYSSLSSLSSELFFFVFLGLFILIIEFNPHSLNFCSSLSKTSTYSESFVFKALPSRISSLLLEVESVEIK